MTQIPSKYTLEIVDPSGLVLADLTSRTRSRRVSKSRNEPDEISWTTDLDEFEAYCRAQGIKDPATFLANGRNEVRVKRGKTYIAGGQLTYWNAQADDRGKTLELRAVGFLNLLAARYTSAEFQATDGADIARTLISTTQAQANGDFGIQLGKTASVGLWNKVYARQSIKDALQELAQSPTRGFDYEFTPTKVFNIYTRIGSDRTKDIVFEDPGSIIQWSLPNDATNLANEVIGIGNGNGDESQAIYTGDSLTSQTTYAIRQKFLQRSSTDNSDGSLQDLVEAELSAYAFPFEVPSIVVDANKRPFVTEYGIGDIVRVRLAGSDISRHIDAGYGIERIDLEVDDDDNEKATLALRV